jgi:hypothetical protein
LIEKPSSTEERVLEESAWKYLSFWIDTASEFGCSAKIKAETSALPLFQRKEGIARDDILVIGQPLRKGL